MVLRTNCRVLPTSTKSSLLTQHRNALRPHDGILTGHPPAERPLDLGAECERCEEIRLLRRRAIPLLLQLGAREPVETVAQLLDRSQSTVAVCGHGGGGLGDGRRVGGRVALGSTLRRVLDRPCQHL